MTHEHHFWRFTPYVQGQAIMRPAFYRCACGEIGYAAPEETP